jgi:hypothetical protein
MTHGDDKGLRLPPAVAPIQAPPPTPHRLTHTTLHVSSSPNAQSATRGRSRSSRSWVGRSTRRRTGAPRCGRRATPCGAGWSARVCAVTSTTATSRSDGRYSPVPERLYRAAGGPLRQLAVVAISAPHSLPSSTKIGCCAGSFETGKRRGCHCGSKSASRFVSPAFCTLPALLSKAAISHSACLTAGTGVEVAAGQTARRWRLRPYRAGR